MTAYLSPVPKLQFIDANGNPVVGGKLYTYAAGTTTPQVTYTDAAGTTPNANPVILDSMGMASVWLSGNSYKMVLKTSTDVELWTADNISADTTLAQLAIGSGSSLVGFTQSGSGAIVTTAQAKMRQWVSVADFIPAGTNISTTDCQPYIRAALNELIARGGGTLIIPPGDYRITTVESAAAHFYLVTVNDINILGYGATLRSTYSNTSSSTTAMFLLDGANRWNIEGLNIIGLFTRNLNVFTNYAIGAFMLQSSTRDANSICIKNVRAESCHYFVIARANVPASGFRVRGVHVENCLYDYGFYGVNCQNNGDNFTVTNFRTIRAGRSYFVYGVSHHKASYMAYFNDIFTDCVIAAIPLNTSDIEVDAFQFGLTSPNAHATFESQHDPVAQPVPGTITNVRVNVNDLLSNTPTSSGSIRFVYWQNGVEQTTSSHKLFDNIILTGEVSGYIDFAVAQPANSGRLDISQLKYDPIGTALPSAKGFFQQMAVGVSSDSTAGLKVKGVGTVAVYGSTLFYDFADVFLGYADASIGATAFNWYSNVGKPWNFSYGYGGAYSAGTLVWSVIPFGATAYGVRIYEGSNNSTPNAANSVMKIGQMDTTARSISAAGTYNASGADYAEYENNNGLTIAKGSIVGFKADGVLTLTYSEAVRFGVKSTNPSFVGGDTWAPDDNLSPEELEALRANVDRVAYSGKVPVNVYDAAPGDYIIPVPDEDGQITGEVIIQPTFDQYRRAVGRVNRILEDGRAEIAVIIH